MRPSPPSHPSSRIASLQSFGELSGFLRENVADEESRELSDSVSALAVHIEAVITARRKIIALPDLLAHIRVLMDYLREHRLSISRLGAAWSSIYEYNSYVRGVQQLYGALVQWVHSLQIRSPEEKRRFEAFDLLAWRTLGEGALLLDMYQQSMEDDGAMPDSAAPPQPRSFVARIAAWWRGPRREQ